MSERTERPAERVERMEARGAKQEAGGMDFMAGSAASRPTARKELVEGRVARPQKQAEGMEKHEAKSSTQMGSADHREARPSGQAERLDNREARPAGQMEHAASRAARPSGQAKHVENQEAHPAGTMARMGSPASGMSGLMERAKGRAERPTGRAERPESMRIHPAAAAIRSERTSSQTAHPIYTLADIYMTESPYEQITVLKIVKEVNEHIQLTLSGIVPEDKLDVYIERISDNEPIEVYTQTEESGKRTLFHGIITNARIQVVQNVRTLTIEAHSRTFLMDLKKETRSYQNGQQTYEQILNQLASDYPNANVVDEASKGKAIGGLIMQYLETDWAFAKRLASHFNMPLLAISAMPGIRFYAGLPEAGGEVVLMETNYSIRKEMGVYKQLAENSKASFTEQGRMIYEVTSHTAIELGSAVQFQRRSLFVYRVEARTEQGLLVYHYDLRERDGFRCGTRYLEEITGISLFGTIAGVEKDKVKLKLKIDGGGADTWFPYSTVYSSPDGSGWYCMPEIGDEARLYFPDAEEKNAFAASSVDVASSDTTKRSDPAVKSISTKYGKQIVFQPGAVEIIGGGQMLMRLTDDGGIEINSDKKIMLSAVEDIEITSEANILIQGETGIDLKQGDAMLTVQDEVTLSGGKVNIV
ncbi:contractile injection system protein, VgrG/Pvc8 family [Paenibacillus algorifonticola]|uniref:contractile injection system protein, VgrG/Pvc8 family n=1 Tax=Paenibacillus algorifonticola TaxID=684063 RepID=UPI003D2DAE6B